jgi:hypothetical protein
MEKEKSDRKPVRRLGGHFEDHDRRLACGHLFSRAAHHPWCRFCLHEVHINHSTHNWRLHHKGKHRKKCLKNRRTKPKIADVKAKAEARLKSHRNTKIYKKSLHSEECHLVRNILFSNGSRGRFYNLSPSDRKIVREYRDRMYSEYAARVELTGKAPKTKWRWSRYWWGNLKAMYGMDVVKSMKIESAMGTAMDTTDTA